MAFGFFDGQKADASPESIKRKRALIAQLLSGNSRAPRNIGEGFQAIGTNLAAAIEGSRADAEEKAGNAERSRIMGGIGFGGAPMAAVSGAPVATGSAAPRAVAAPEQFAALFAEQEAKYGLPQGYLARTAQIESNFNPNAKNPNSSAGGLFQFINSTARQYGLANRFDPVAATASAARLASDNRDFLARRLGREPSAGELYLAHQQGAGGAAKLLANPNASASSVVGDAAARLNRGAGMTANAFANQWINKFGTPVVRPGPGATPMPLAQPIQTASAGPQGNEAQMQDGAGELQAGGSGLMAEPAVYRGELNNLPAGDLMQRGPMPALPEGFDVSSLITPAGQPSGAQGIADNEEQTRAMEAQMAAEQGLPYAGNEPGLLSPVPMGFGPNPFLPYEPDAMAQAPAAPAPSMNRATFDQVTAELPRRALSFTGPNAGLAPSWGIGDPDAPAPDAQEVSVRPARDTVSLPAANIQPPQSPAMRAPLPVDMGGENGAGAMQFIESEFARREGRPDPRMAIGAPQGVYNPFVPQALQAPQMAGDGGSVQGASQGGAMASGAAQPQQAGMITPQNVRAVMSSPFTSDADKRFVMDMWNQQQARAQAEAERQRVAEQNRQTARDLGIPESLGGVAPVVTARAQQKYAKPEPATSDQRELEQINKERRAANLPELRMDQWKIEKAKAGAQTLDLTGGSSKQIFDTLKERTDAASTAATGLNALREARKAVNDGGFFGAGADQRLGFAKIGALLGFEDGRITNVETFRSAIAPQVAAVMKATVGSTQISNQDREFAEKAAGGNITLDEKSIKRLLDIMERSSVDIITRHQKQLDAVYPESPDGKFARERALFGVQVPPAPTQTGPARPSSKAEFDALKSGTLYVDPEGNERRKR